MRAEDGGEELDLDDLLEGALEGDQRGRRLGLKKGAVLQRPIDPLLRADALLQRPQRRIRYRLLSPVLEQ